MILRCLGGKECRFASQSYPHSLIVRGVTPLHAREVAIPDLRAGFAYVMAATIAEGTSTLTGLPFIDRGYEDVEGKLQSLGVDVTRVQLDTAPEELQIPYNSRTIQQLTACQIDRREEQKINNN